MSDYNRQYTKENLSLEDLRRVDPDELALVVGCLRSCWPNQLPGTAVSEVSLALMVGRNDVILHLEKVLEELTEPETDVSGHP